MIWAYYWLIIFHFYFTQFKATILCCSLLIILKMRRKRFVEFCGEIPNDRTAGHVPGNTTWFLLQHTSYWNMLFFILSYIRKFLYMIYIILRLSSDEWIDWPPVWPYNTKYYFVRILLSTSSFKIHRESRSDTSPNNIQWNEFVAP